MTTGRDMLSQIAPAIGAPNPNEKPIIAKTKPALSSVIPICVSVTAKTGSTHIMQIIAKVQLTTAVKDRLLLKIVL